MTKEEFISWLDGYLKRCEQDQIATIKEKLSLVNTNDIQYNYWSNVDPNRISKTGDKLSFTVDATNNTITTNYLNDNEIR